MHNKESVWARQSSMSGALDDPRPGDVAPPLPRPVGVNLLGISVGLDGHHPGGLLHNLCMIIIIKPITIIIIVMIHHLSVGDGLGRGRGALLR